MSEFNFQVKDQVPNDVKANYSNDGVRYTSRLYSTPPPVRGHPSDEMFSNEKTRMTGLPHVEDMVIR